MDEMIDRITEKLIAAGAGPRDARRFAEIGLEVLRKPTPAMCLKGAMVMSVVHPAGIPIAAPVAFAQPRDVFTAMIDGALGRK